MQPETTSRALLSWLRSRLRPDPRRTLGRRGERLAARHLKRAGYRILDRNLTSRLGEVDLLAEAPDRRTIVVVEVKAGRGGTLPPEARVGSAKRRKLVALAVQILRRRQLQHRPLRFDVIGIDIPPRGRPTVRHHPGAFESHV